jgi:hypothetical protein
MSDWEDWRNTGNAERVDVREPGGLNEIPEEIELTPTEEQHKQDAAREASIVGAVRGAVRHELEQLGFLGPSSGWADNLAPVGNVVYVGSDGEMVVAPLFFSRFDGPEDVVLVATVALSRSGMRLEVQG